MSSNFKQTVNLCKERFQVIDWEETLGGNLFQVFDSHFNKDLFLHIPMTYMLTYAEVLVKAQDRLEHFDTAEDILLSFVDRDWDLMCINYIAQKQYNKNRSLTVFDGSWN